MVGGVGNAALEIGQACWPDLLGLTQDQDVRHIPIPFGDRHHRRSADYDSLSTCPKPGGDLTHPRALEVHAGDPDDVAVRIPVDGGDVLVAESRDMAVGNHRGDGQEPEWWIGGLPERHARAVGPFDEKLSGRRGLTRWIFTTDDSRASPTAASDSRQVERGPSTE